MQQAVAENVTKLSEGAVEVFPIMNHLAFEVVAKSLFTYENNDVTLERLEQITHDIQVNLIKEIRQPFKRWYFHLNGQLKHTEALAQEARDLILAIIEARREQAKTYDDLLDMLLASTYEDGSKMTNEQLIDEILILFVAGHKTTSNALRACLTKKD